VPAWFGQGLCDTRPALAAAGTAQGSNALHVYLLLGAVCPDTCFG